MMSVKWFFTISLILLAGAVCTVNAAPFALQATSHCMACNDSNLGPTGHRSEASSDVRNYESGLETRRRVAYYRYDISALQQSHKVFANCYLTLNVTKRDAASSHLNVYAINESMDNIPDLVGQSWSTLPGVLNNPQPALGQELTVDILDTEDISPLLLSYVPTSLNAWASTPVSISLDNILNADTDGTIILMFICYDPQNSGLEIRSPKATEAIEPETELLGIILRGDIAAGKAYNPVPANGSSVSPDLTQLSWTKPDPNLPGATVTCDVFFHEVDTDPNTPDDPNWVNDPNALLSNYGYTLLAAGIPGNSVTLPAALTRDKTYRWIVDTHDTTRVPQKTQGFLWTFNTNNVVPVVDAGSAQYLWLNNAGDPAAATVNLTGVVTDDNYPSPYTLLWTQIAGPVTVTISPDTTPATTIVLPQVGMYKFKLTANDGAASGSDVVYVYVGATPCAAAQAKPGYAAYAGDYNSDCFVNMTDFAAMAGNWLECNSLSSCN